MFDIGWGKILIVGMVALIVIGPHELPEVLRTLGKTVNKLKRMASDFQYQFSQALNETGVNEAKSSIDNATNFNPVSYARDSIKDAIEDFKPNVDPVGPPSLKDLPDPVIAPVSHEPAPPIDLLPPKLPEVKS